MKTESDGKKSSCSSCGFEDYYLVFQPIFNNCLEITGAESLLRSKSAENAEMILVKSDLKGSIYNLSLWIFEQSLIALKQFQKYKSKFCMNINISADQLKNSKISDDILEMIERNNISCHCVVIEITENAELLNRKLIQNILRYWQSKGIRILMDDFGTGYSSLKRLLTYRFDEIKLDRCLVQNIDQQSMKYHLVRSILSFFSQCKTECVCEGIETKEEFHMIQTLKPERLQGFYLGKPCDRKMFIKKYLDVDKKFNQEI